VNECERSYSKEKTFLTEHNMVCRNLIGRDFNKYPNIEKKVDEVTKGLTFSGKNLMSKFMNNNKKMENDLRNNENNFFIYTHSKPPLELNKWKFSNHIIKQFSVPELDKIYSFKTDAPPEPKYMTKPFRRPKIYGDFFDKKIGILGN
jgi:hypothetical protein